MIRKVVFNAVFLTYLIYATSVSADIVDTENMYTFEEMERDIIELANKYPDVISYKSIGKSEFGRNIWAIKLGKGDPLLFINGSHHAREWITTVLNMKMIEEYAEAYTKNKKIEKYSIRDLLNKGAIWFVPMVNPDGVTLQQKGINEFPMHYHVPLLKMNDWSYDFTRWKANAKGVDLNRQYPAGWSGPSSTVRPYWWNYKGVKPFQAKETIAMRNFTYEIDPIISVAYHSSGRVLYWHYYNKIENYSRDYNLAKTFSQKTGYHLIPPSTNPSGRGYTDWFIQEFGRPGFTPELSYPVGDRHVPMSVFPEIWQRNADIPAWLLTEAFKIKDKRHSFKGGYFKARTK